MLLVWNRGMILNVKCMQVLAASAWIAFANYVLSYCVDLLEPAMFSEHWTDTGPIYWQIRTCVDKDGQCCRMGVSFYSFQSSALHKYLPPFEVHSDGTEVGFTFEYSSRYCDILVDPRLAAITAATLQAYLFITLAYLGPVLMAKLLKLGLQIPNRIWALTGQELLQWSFGSVVEAVGRWCSALHSAALLLTGKDFLLGSSCIWFSMSLLIKIHNATITMLHYRHGVLKVLGFHQTSHFVPRT